MQGNIKCEAEKQKEFNASFLSGAATPLRQPSLRERINDQMYRANKEAMKFERLAELAALLEKHPDVARILDLLDEVRS